MNCPSGFRQSEAIFARNLLDAIPAEIVTPTSLRTLPLISVAIFVALPPATVDSETSRNASSRDKGSIFLE